MSLGSIRFRCCCQRLRRDWQWIRKRNANKSDPLRSNGLEGPSVGFRLPRWCYLTTRCACISSCRPAVRHRCWALFTNPVDSSARAPTSTPAPARLERPKIKRRADVVGVVRNTCLVQALRGVGPRQHPCQLCNLGYRSIPRSPGDGGDSGAVGAVTCACASTPTCSRKSR